jgi:hypothetical protein
MSGPLEATVPMAGLKWPSIFQAARGSGGASCLLPQTVARQGRAASMMHGAGAGHWPQYCHTCLCYLLSDQKASHVNRLNCN